MTVSEDTASPSLKIDLTDLRKITEKLFDHIINTRNEKQVVIDKSFYWNIPFDELFDMGKRPKNLDIGSLSDEWEFVSELLEDNAIPVAFQFTELATLFRLIGEKMGEKLASKGG